MPQLLQQNIIEALDMEHLSETERLTWLEKIGEIVFQGAMLKAMSMLSEEQQTQLNILLGEANADGANEEQQEKAITFLRAAAADFDALIAEEVRTLVLEYKKEEGRDVSE